MSANKITVVLNTHKGYLQFLPKAIAAILNQTVQPRKVFLCYDGDDRDLPMHLVPADWEVFSGEHGNPNPLRNLAVRHCRTTWLIFADGDDFMDPGYVSACADGIASIPARAKVGIVYNEVHYSDGKKLDVPKYDYWTLRQRNYVSAASAWRRKAIEEAGYWPEDTQCYDDYTLALKVTRAGWDGLKGTGVVRVNCHDAGHRRYAQRTHKQWTHIWHYRHYAILTLFAGRSHLLPKYFEWVNGAKAAGKLAPNTVLVAVDNSRDPKFRALLDAALAGTGLPYTLHVDESTIDPKDKLGKHTLVAELYTRYLDKLDADFVLMLEDDVFPPVKGMYDLAKAWDYHRKPAAIGGVYLSRHNKGARPGWSSFVVASNHPRHWAVDVTLEQVVRHKMYHPNEELFPVRQIAGGFTLWNMGCVKKVLPIAAGPSPDTGIDIGWDSDLSFKTGRIGYQRYLHADVICDHNYVGT